MGKTPSAIKNKMKREQVYHAQRRDKEQAKLEKRMKRRKAETDEERAARKAVNVPKTLDNTREYDPTIIGSTSAAAAAAAAAPVPSTSALPPTGADDGQPSPSADATSEPTSTPADPSSMPLGTDDPETAFDLQTDAFASYFTPTPSDPNDPDSPPLPPKILITTSAQASKATYEFCDELVGVLPGSEFVRRLKGKGFEVGRIAGWARGRGYSDLVVVNEDHKAPNAITLIHLPHGPTAYFKLTSIQTSKSITGHARPTPHHPELVLNNFVTRLGHTVGRMFQALFPPVPDFEGRQVVTFHVQRDFIFFRRHRYAFKSTEKTALQEIGPRFTLKLRWLKKGTPGVRMAVDNRPAEAKDAEDVGGFEWQWKSELETSRRRFFL